MKDEKEGKDVRVKENEEFDEREREERWEEGRRKGGKDKYTSK